MIWFLLKNACRHLACCFLQAFSSRSKHRYFIEKNNTFFSLNFQNEKRDPSLMQDYGNDPQFADPSIDTMREQKLAVRCWFSFLLLKSAFASLIKNKTS